MNSKGEGDEVTREGVGKGQGVALLLTRHGVSRARLVKGSRM